MIYSTVDRMADLQAAAQKLLDEVDLLKSKLKERGDGKYSGRRFVASIVSSERCSLDMQQVRLLLTAKQLKKLQRRKAVTTCSLKEIQ